MRASIKHFVKICTEILPLAEPIYEFGSLQVPGQEGFADLRPFFPGREYVGADMRAGPGVDVVLDLSRTNLPAESVGTVLTMDTLEHVEYVREAVLEAYRILKPEGILIMSSVMNYAIHDFPYDYWRFTPEGFRSLLKPFATRVVAHAGDPEFPRTVLGLGFKSPPPDYLMALLNVHLAEWQEIYGDKEKSWLRRTKELLVPPILRVMWRGVRKGLSYLVPR
jgi:SAM-dependent methyltransferase